MTYLFFKHAHSIIRWALLILLIYSIVNSVFKVLTKEKFNKADKQINSSVVYFAHFQLLIGFILYFISGKVVFSLSSLSNSFLRFFLVEHVLGMLIAVTLITIGSSSSKKAKTDKKKHIKILTYYGLSLLIIFFSIPRPWDKLGARWF